MKLTDQLPYYVTRKTADGYTAYFSLPAWLLLTAAKLFWLNVIVWGVVGLIVAVRVVL